LKGLSSRTGWHDLKDWARRCGDVEYADIWIVENGKRYGVVKFIKKKDCKAAVEELDGQSLDGRKLRVEEDTGDFSYSRSRSRSGGRRSRSRSRSPSKSRSRSRGKRSRSDSRKRGKDKERSKEKKEKEPDKDGAKTTKEGEQQSPGQTDRLTEESLYL